MNPLPDDSTSDDASPFAGLHEGVTRSKGKAWSGRDILSKTVAYCLLLIGMSITGSVFVLPLHGVEEWVMRSIYYGGLLVCGLAFAVYDKRLSSFLKRKLRR